MTGGQVSPLTELGEHGTTAPYGQPERPFDISALAQAAGATYVARGVSSNPRQLQRLIREAIQHRGFAFVEAVVQCPTEFGRRNPPQDAVAMVNEMKSRAVPISKVQELSADERAACIVTGLLYEDKQVQEYGEMYAALVTRAMEGEDDKGPA